MTNHATFIPGIVHRPKLPVVKNGEQFFACQKYGATMRKAVCADRHRRANVTSVAPGSEQMGAAPYTISLCRGCEVGKAHRSGQDGAPVIAAPTPPVGHVPPKGPEKKRRSVTREAEGLAAAGRVVAAMRARQPVKVKRDYDTK